MGRCMITNHFQLLSTSSDGVSVVVSPLGRTAPSSFTSSLRLWLATQVFFTQTSFAVSFLVCPLFSYVIHCVILLLCDIFCCAPFWLGRKILVWTYVLILLISIWDLLRLRTRNGIWHVMDFRTSPADITASQRTPPRPVSSSMSLMVSPWEMRALMSLVFTWPHLDMALNVTTPKNISIWWQSRKIEASTGAEFRCNQSHQRNGLPFRAIKPRNKS